MSNLVLNVKKKALRRKKKNYFKLLYIIIPFLAFFSYVYYTTTLSPVGVLGIFISVEPKSKYETFKVSFDENIPLEMQEMIRVSVDDIKLGDRKRFEFVKRGDYVIKQSNDSSNSFFFKEYLPVGHLYWIKGDVKLEDEKKILVSEEDFKSLSYLVGEEKLVKTKNIIESLKGSEESIGLVSLSEITPQMKILSINGKYPLEEETSSFVLGYTLEGDDERDFVSHILSRNMEIKYGLSSNSRSESIVKINMGGVVAISRGLASKIDSLKNYSYPAQSIGSFLADADLTHVSNEVSFVSGCTGYTGMRFCSKPEYVETLKASGVDIVELTGNHNNDYGASNNAKTIEKYKELGWDYFGGGLDITDASKILYKEVKGSKIAFVGYNYYDTMLNTAAIANSVHAGANSYSEEKLKEDIAKAKESADIVIVTFQFQECYCYPSSDVIFPVCYKPLSSPDQKKVFRQAIDFGANIVVGTQAHQPQTYEIYNDGLIYYGLGNLYFDQYIWIGTRQGLVLTLYINDGSLLQAKLTPILMGRDLIPKIASEKDGELLLNLLKSARTF